MYLTWSALSFPCPVDPSQKAILSPQFRSFVNYEVYFFSSTSAMKKFNKSPLKYCGVLTDPVSRVRFQPTGKSPHWDYMDRPYYFASDSTLMAFRAMPDSFAVRRGM
jgi:YHS domain-containing protein